jgi:hypothetical protein
MQRDAIPEKELERMMDSWSKITKEKWQADSYTMATLIMALGARRAGDILRKLVAKKWTRPPLVQDVTFLPQGCQPDANECVAMVIHLTKTKNEMVSGHVEAVIPNLPGKFSVGAAFTRMWGHIPVPADSMKCPLLLGRNGESLKYTQYAHAMKKVAKLLGWSESMSRTHCFRKTITTSGARKGMSDRQLCTIGDWHSNAFKRYNVPTLMDKASILKTAAPVRTRR